MSIYTYRDVVVVVVVVIVIVIVVVVVVASLLEGVGKVACNYFA